MKFELNLAVKAVPMADCHVSIECTAEELAVALADPVYQEIGHALATKLSQAQSADHRDNNHKANHAQPNDRVEYLRRVVETEVKRQKSHNETVDTAIKSLQDQMTRMFNRVINNSSITKF